MRTFFPKSIRTGKCFTARPTPEITKKVMQSPFFMKNSLFTALPGKITNHGFFYKISLGKNGFWTKINVHFRSANHFLCFDILSRSENPYQKTSKKQPPYKDLRKGFGTSFRGGILQTLSKNTYSRNVLY
jgi:hypothetical protein